MPVTRFLAAFVALSVGTAGIAQSPASAPVPAPAPPANPEVTVTGDKLPSQEKLVCKSSNTGSMIGKRICMTKSEWAKLEQRADDGLDRLRDWQRVRCSFGSVC